MKKYKTKENIQTIGEVLKNGTRAVANDDKNICPYCKKPKVTKKYGNFAIYSSTVHTTDDVFLQ